MPHLGRARDQRSCDPSWLVAASQPAWMVSPQVIPNSLSYPRPLCWPQRQEDRTKEAIAVGNPRGQWITGQLDSNIIGSAPLLVACLANTQGHSLQPTMREKTKYFPLFGRVLLITCAKHDCKRYWLRIFQSVLSQVWHQNRSSDFKKGLNNAKKLSCCKKKKKIKFYHTCWGSRFSHSCCASCSS